MPSASLTRLLCRSPAATPGRTFALFLYYVAGYLATTAFAQFGRGESTTQKPAAGGAPLTGSLYIKEYRVRGNHRLSRSEVEEAVYPYLGPGRSADDVEQARSSLEKLIQSKGFQTIAVQIPAQNPAGGTVYLQIVESTVGRLRVRDARYSLPSRIKAEVPSLAEGNVPNFNQVSSQVVDLNQAPDRRVTPSLSAGVIPGTVDIDLKVDDTLPLHGSLELNNRYSVNTSPLRLSASASYDNLWQLNHTIGASLQISPEDLSQVQVYSGYYVARIPGWTGVSFVAQGVKQQSNVNTLGDIAVAGRGDVEGLRTILSLPGATDFYHTVTFGFDRKDFDQDVTIAGKTAPTPVTYYPFSLNYTATWSPKGSITTADTGLTFATRELGSDTAQFDANRFKANGNFFYVRGDISHQRDLPAGFQVFGKLQGQIADQPLVNSEQFAGGGLGTVRGYLEAEVLGDDGVAATIELRSPSVLPTSAAAGDEWRFYLFAEGGYYSLLEPLPQQTDNFALASIGLGTRVHWREHFNGSLDLAIPLTSESATDAFDPRATFRVWGEF
jgi:hemolysin activation/secretion protein